MLTLSSRSGNTTRTLSGDVALGKFGGNFPSIGALVGLSVAAGLVVRADVELVLALAAIGVAERVLPCTLVSRPVLGLLLLHFPSLLWLSLAH
jgi:hypothetical protein